MWSQTCNASSVALNDINKALSEDARSFFLSAYPHSRILPMIHVHIPPQPHTLSHSILISPFSPVRGLCANSACDNIQVTVTKRSLLCQPLSCNATSISCNDYAFNITVKACMYDVRGIGGTVGNESALRSAGTLLLWVRPAIDTLA
ncbi:hypothetical protein PoB_006144800 [Plakobranchus ocellatus]|uniref:Uncharacterized protein n=1 Tax=Plakobranchus ocellatus TaxID=259542 RepID=A0AAV4CSW0_9GAST|nr:hypothetical protein PoB_006144800 [Plakobranchus ocellatus]